MKDDVLFSNDLELLRLEIVRLRTYLESSCKEVDVYRSRCEACESIVKELIAHEYGKN